ncbi:MAG: chromosomal replication initiator protein DnaA [Tannerellaceae bacterium]|jgi:chromosomal replication initiator protein|nr:chromosomal replication initiator protein DnaA [Tannerellaceae bacterium]
MNNHLELWAQCLTVIRDIVPEAVYNTWFKPIKPLSYENNKFTIQVPSQFFYEYIEEKYAPTVLKITIDRVIGPGTILNYRVMVDTSTGSTIDYPTERGTAYTAVAQKPENKASALFIPAAPQDLNSYLNPKYNFENFLEGRSNRFVRVAGQQVAANPGRTAFNPLFIFGQSGVGKTHFCNAVGVQIKELAPELKVVCVSSQIFKTQYAEATRKNMSNDFLHFYQSLDVLIIDDIQEFIGLEKTQNTFFHIFNHLHQLNKQLILTSDKPPVDMHGMEERMITRLRWGLTAELFRPDIELRRKILRYKATLDSINIDDDVINFIAEHVINNVRDLEGILISLYAYSVISNVPIDIALAKRIIGQSLPIVDKQKHTIEGIQELICDYFNLTPADIHTASRKREKVQARQITMYFARIYTDRSLEHIGKVVGGRDHATVMHAIKTIQDQMKFDKQFKAMIDDIDKRLNF